MKLKNLSLLLVVLLTLIAFAVPAFAVIGPIIPIDPIIIGPPILIFDPCSGASLIAVVTNNNYFDESSGGNYSTYINTYDLTVSGTVVAHGISTYKRVTVGSTSNVTQEDTFIDPGDSVTVFGHSVNRDRTGLMGGQGVISGAVNFNGTANTSIKGYYKFSDWTSTDRFCAFLQ